MKLRSRTSQLKQFDLFQWADAQQTRNRRTSIVRQVISRCRVTELHAQAFIEANGLGGEVR